MVRKRGAPKANKTQLMIFFPNWAVIGFIGYFVILATPTMALFDVDAEFIVLAEQRRVLEGVHSRESADRAKNHPETQEATLLS